jgi:ferredoxin
MPTVTFLRGDGRDTVDVAPGASLFDAGAQIRAGIETACVGKGTCGLCRVRVVAGAEHLNAYTEEESRHLGNVYHLTKVRLACRCKPTGDVAIEVVHRRKG